MFIYGSEWSLENHELTLMHNPFFWCTILEAPIRQQASGIIHPLCKRSPPTTDRCILSWECSGESGIESKLHSHVLTQEYFRLMQKSKWIALTVVWWGFIWNLWLMQGNSYSWLSGAPEIIDLHSFSKQLNTWQANRDYLPRWDRAR